MNPCLRDSSSVSAGWRLPAPALFGTQIFFYLGERMKFIPRLENFNLFNNKNNVNPLSAPALFDFSGFLRVGVGDPRQAQLSARFEF